MKQVKKGILENLQKGIPLKVRPGHTVRLEVSEEPLKIYTGLSLFYAMIGTLDIPRVLGEDVKVKEREPGYPESEHILALAANAFIGGDYLNHPCSFTTERIEAIVQSRNERFNYGFYKANLFRIG